MDQKWLGYRPRVRANIRARGLGCSQTMTHCENEWMLAAAALRTWRHCGLSVRPQTFEPLPSQCRISDISDVQPGLALY